MLLVIALASITLYLLATCLRYLALINQSNKLQRVFFLLGIAAVILNAGLLYHLIDLSAGQNLNFPNRLAFILWVICLITLVGAFFQRSLTNLSLFIFPITALSIAYATLLPGNLHIIPTAAHPKELLHILLAAVAFSVFCLAAIQAVILAMQDYLLRRKFSSTIIKKLPPLETMERVLFQLIGLGFLLLTLLLGSSVYFFPNPFAPPLLQKTVLTLTAWVVFIVLLAGRYFFGWRGRRIIYYTLSGFILLIVIYFSSSSIA